MANRSFLTCKSWTSAALITVTVLYASSMFGNATKLTKDANKDALASSLMTAEIYASGDVGISKHEHQAQPSFLQMNDAAEAKGDFWQNLKEAIESDDYQNVRTAISDAERSEALANVLLMKTADGSTLLHLASKRGNGSIVHELVQAAKKVGTQAALKDLIMSKERALTELTVLNSRRTPTSADIQLKINALSESIASLKSAELSGGMFWEVLRAKTQAGKTPLMLAREALNQIQSVISLLEAAEVKPFFLEAKEDEWRTIQQAIESDDVQKVRAAMSLAERSGALANILLMKTADGSNLLHLASKRANAEIVHLLVEAAKRMRTPTSNQDILEEAKNAGWVVWQVVHAATSEDKTPLMLAREALNQIQSVISLLEAADREKFGVSSS